ncbi:hypothetical protein PDE_05298 [Penicillium oxalicum 114-2]|uniref:DUF7165 domain-containing protein n=1 Tax=Penicillium oxalicum (strain 114-2 / CGMCC 5302) TaxID=933388 RepID=S8B6R1_PENO1|nr:hypothetical protein PDE_05298 [Penicillium oxalicum 114-2]
MEEEPSSFHGTGAFDRLPVNVIELILYAADANVFASLTLLNRQWRRVSESCSLYAHHLAQCPSLVWSKGPQKRIPDETSSLKDLKRQFLEEVRRNAFDVFLRPRRKLVRLISSSMSSSTPSPQGEVFRFSFSAHGRLLLCTSSSRIVVLEVAKDPIIVKYELQTRRRPLGATILDDGTLLAVQSSTHRINIYQLSEQGARHLQTISLNEAPRDLSFAPMGSVLALSFEDCIEVHAVGESALSTERRAARCPRVDALCFSSDGAMLLGSPVDHGHGGIVTIPAPFDTDIAIDASPLELQMRMWTTQILFPDFIPGFSHACLVRGHEEADDSWVIGYDNTLAAFRSIKVNAVNTGGVFFASPFLPQELRERSPVMLPSTDEGGELLALGFQDSEIWIYGLPVRLDMTSPISNGESTRDTYLCGDHHGHGPVKPCDSRAQLEKVVQQPRKAIIRGRQMTSMAGINAGRWVSRAALSQSSRRLVVVAPGGVRSQLLSQEDVPVDSGRILILDFDRSTTNGREQEIDIEVGETGPIILPEPDSSLDTEVELERRRTRLQRVETDTAVMTNRTTQISTAFAQNTRRTASQHILGQPPLIAAGTETFVHGRTHDEVTDIPYDNAQPRSRDTLRRAATAAASTRQICDPQYRNSTAGELTPFERNANSWATPPPPYSRQAEDSPQAALQASLLQERPVTSHIEAPRPVQPIQRAQTTHTSRVNGPERARPHSSFLQRLGSFASSRRLERSQQGPSGGITESPRPPLASLVFPNQQHTSPHLLMTQNPVHPDPQYQSAPLDTTLPAIPSLSTPIDQVSSPQPLPTLRLHTAGQPAHQEQATLGATILGDNYLSYSVSSPHLLHIPQPSGNALDLTEEDEEADIPARQRSFRQRASTEPTSLPPPENEEWRRRIENWNEQTIRERSRKRRSKCIVM